MEINFAKPALVDGSRPKRMMEYTRDADGRVRIAINYSSLDLIQTCKRKAYYKLIRKLAPREPSRALVFGTAIHRAMETWFIVEPDARKAAKAACDDWQFACLNAMRSELPVPEGHGPCPRCASIWAFLSAGPTLLHDIGDDKRTAANGIAILNHYFDTYLNEPFQIYSDASGPYCERDFEFLLDSSPELEIRYFGTVDKVLKNLETNELYVCDHKTASGLGSDFLNRIKPNWQYTGYVYGANKAWNLPISNFMVDGILVAKHKRDTLRQFVEQTLLDFVEFTTSVIHAASEWAGLRELDNYPMTAPGPCSIYGGCEFREACAAPKAIRENILSVEFTTPEQLKEASA
jgi:hypothetical protein